MIRYLEKKQMKRCLNSTLRAKIANKKHENNKPLRYYHRAKAREGAARKGGFTSPARRASPMGCGAESHVRAIAAILSALLLIGLTAACQSAGQLTTGTTILSPQGAIPLTEQSKSPQLTKAPTPAPSQAAGTTSGKSIEPSATPAAPGNNAAGAGTPGAPSDAPSSGTVAVQRVIVVLKSSEVIKGDVIDPQVVILPADATDKSYTLNSGNENVLRRTDNGWEAVAGGAAELIAISGDGVTGRAAVTVVVPVESISPGTDKIDMNPGDRVTLTPVIVPDDATDRHIQYTSGNSGVAKVSEGGTIEAVGAGTTVIRCYIGKISASCTVTVSIPVANVSLSTDKQIYKVGDQGNITVQISPDDATDKTTTLSISGAAITQTEDNTFSCDAGGEATITATAAGGAAGSQTVKVIDLAAYADEVFTLTNKERKNAGLPAFSKMTALTRAANVRASEIIKSFSHDRPDGRSCFTAFDENNVPYGWAGENIAMGQSSPQEALNDWMNSDGHRENIMKQEYTHMGIGVAMDSDGKLYWTQEFTD